MPPSPDTGTPGAPPPPRGHAVFSRSMPAVVAACANDYKAQCNLPYLSMAIIGGLLVWSLMAILVLLWVWPSKPLVAMTTADVGVVSMSTRYIILSLVGGMLGGLVHAITSATRYAGVRKFYPSWAMWYAARPLVGAILGLVAYFVYAVIDKPNTVQPALAQALLKPEWMFGFSFLAGMFAHATVQWMKTVFDSLLNTNEETKDNLAGSAKTPLKSPPIITQLMVGQAADVTTLALTVIGIQLPGVMEVTTTPNGTQPAWQESHAVLADPMTPSSCKAASGTPALPVTRIIPLRTRLAAGTRVQVQVMGHDQQMSSVAEVIV